MSVDSAGVTKIQWEEGGVPVNVKNLAKERREEFHHHRVTPHHHIQVSGRRSVGPDAADSIKQNH
jgi:hypothetical protein